MHRSLQDQGVHVPPSQSLDAGPQPRNADPTPRPPPTRANLCAWRCPNFQPPISYRIKDGSSFQTDQSVCSRKLTCNLRLFSIAFFPQGSARRKENIRDRSRSPEQVMPLWLPHFFLTSSEILFLF